MKKNAALTLEEMKEKKVTTSLMRETLCLQLMTPTPEDPGSATLSKEDLNRSIRESETDEYLVRTYRALSAAMIPDRYVDFGHKDGKPLKSAVNLFKRKTKGAYVGVFKDHRHEVGAWIGKVLDAYWDKGDEETPPGVNSVLEYDKIALGSAIERGIKSGGLNAVSVTVDFEWEPSHPDMDKWDFLCKLGEEVNGELVRVLVTKIVGIYEISLVWEGADPYAKGVSSASASLEVMPHPGVPPASVLSVSYFGTDSASVPNDNTTETVIPEEEPMEKILQALCEKLGITMPGEGVDLEKLQSDLLGALDQKEAEAETRTKALADATTALTDLNRRLEEAKQITDAYVNELRTDLAVYAKLTMGSDQSAESIIKLAQKCNIEELRALVNEYTARAEQLTPLRCNRCGSQEVSRQSSTKLPAGSVGTASMSGGIRERTIHEVEALFIKEK